MNSKLTTPGVSDLFRPPKTHWYSWAATMATGQLAHNTISVANLVIFGTFPISVAHLSGVAMNADIVSGHSLA